MPIVRWGFLAVVVATALIFWWFKETCQPFLQALMPASMWGIAGSLLLAVPPFHDLWLRLRRDTVQQRARDGPLDFMGTAIAAGWERSRHQLSVLDAVFFLAGVFSLAISFYLEL